jgi:hypothetical protein
VSNLPKDGLMLYVRLSSLINDGWAYADYTYTEAGIPVAPVMTSPSPGATLSGSDVKFTWSAGAGPSAYKLRLGSDGAGSSNLYSSSATTVTSIAVSNLPQSSVTLYAQLSWLMDTTWHSADYQYRAAGGTAVLTGLSCQSSALTGSGADACTVALNKAAPSGGLAIKLASNDSAATVPASVTVASGATSASFSTTVSAVTSAQTATIAASAGNASRTFSIQLGAAVPTLTINAASIAFGDVALNTPSTQSLTLTSTGTAPVTVNSASVSGTGFSSSGATYPLKLSPKQTAILSVEFEPTTAGAASGTLTISSNSSTNPIAKIALTGAGASNSGSYEIDLTWSAPSSSPDPVFKYNIYRSPSGSSNYQLMGSVSSTNFSFTDDNNIENGQTYDYIVESVDSSGDESAPSNMANVSVP